MPFTKRRSAMFIVIIMFVGALGYMLADIRHNLDAEMGKLWRVVNLADNNYVEDVDWNHTVEGAIKGMLENLDPHSVYIPPDKVRENKENFNAKYEGIGVQFEMIDGYITVISPIAGSPSYKLGILPGDRIVAIDGQKAVGIAADDVPAKLKGPKGSSVRIDVQRNGVDRPLTFTIVRDIIPISTLTASFMLDDSTGYIRVSRFATITARETEEALQALEGQSLKRLILDLRWNSGGYLHEAVKLAGKFIRGHRMVVYTRGRSEAVEERYYADQFGRKIVRDYPLIVLINRGSASASEIVAGAIQDYDRGLIVGENSFGKGLVQKEYSLQDGSAVRLTTAKYYTPSGRCIQREYKGKKVEAYYDDIPDSSWHSLDSLQNRPLFRTGHGRPVYGGGGIQPDAYVVRPPLAVSSRLYNEMLHHQVFFEYATQLVGRFAERRTTLTDFAAAFHLSDRLMNDFRELCLSKDIAFSNDEFSADVDAYQLQIKAEMARCWWENTGFYYVMAGADGQIQSALRLFPEAEKLAALER